MCINGSSAVQILQKRIIRGNREKKREAIQWEEKQQTSFISYSITEIIICCPNGFSLDSWRCPLSTWVGIKLHQGNFIIFLFVSCRAKLNSSLWMFRFAIDPDAEVVALSPKSLIAKTHYFAKSATRVSKETKTYSFIVEATICHGN